MSYLKELYGKEGRNFIRGLKAGVELHAWYDEDVQYVGNKNMKLEDALKEIDEELTKKIKKVNR